jgi:hypothetical protein
MLDFGQVVAVPAKELFAAIRVVDDGSVNEC